MIAVSLYVVVIFSSCFFVLKWKLPQGQRYLIRGAFLTLCFTIIWSLLYAFSNLTGTGLIGMPDMLAFHGILNYLFFGSVIVLAWSLSIPPTKQNDFTFPLSQIRGKLPISTQPHTGLVDDMGDSINKEEIPTLIGKFYK